MKHSKTDLMPCIGSSPLNLLIGLFLVFGISFVPTNMAYATPTSLTTGEFNPSHSAVIFGGKKKAKKGDAFSCKSKKGPNIYSSKPPRSKSRSVMYRHAMSKKRVKKNNNAVFSTTKRRYNVLDSKRGNRNSRGFGGRKSTRAQK